jgi:hypothetical protein
MTNIIHFKINSCSFNIYIYIFLLHCAATNVKKNFSWISGLEWEDALHTNCLSLSEERKLKIIITKIASYVNRRKMLLRPYFQDYELV